MGVFDVVVVVLPPLEGDNQVRPSFIVATDSTTHPYTVCRAKTTTPALSHEEAIRASEIKKTRQDEKLYVRPVKNWEAQ